MKNLIEVSHVSKSYGKVQALRDVSFSVKQGELFGLIGPDGAGKSTLFRILTTLLLPDQGSARVLDADVRVDFRTIRQSVGYMPGRFSLYQDLTVEENLRFFATVFHTTVEENYERIRVIYEQIAPFKQRRAGALSGGMKQKLALCCALVHAPKVLFLDEPTTGVDPVSRREFWKMLAYLRQEGITLVVSTPFMDEALRCDRVAFLYEGEIKGIDRPEAILKQFSEILCPPGLQRKAVDKHTPPIIQVDNLVKRFGSFTAVDHISFSVQRGEIFGFLGANGAGKTTAMRILCGLSLPSEGKAEVMGFDVRTQSEEIKKRIGYMSQKFSLYEDLTVSSSVRRYLWRQCQRNQQTYGRNLTAYRTLRGTTYLSPFAAFRMEATVGLFSSYLPPSGTGFSGRTDRRSRPGYPPSVLGADLSGCRPGDYHFCHDALHGRS